MAEAIPKKYLYDGRGKDGRRWVSDGFHACKTGQTTAADEIAIRAFKASVVTGGIRVKMHDQERCLDGKVVNKLQ